VDFNNTPHIAYTSFAIGSTTPLPFVMYARWNGVGWSTQAIDLWYANSFDLDVYGNPHILYSGLSGLMYATLSESNLVKQTVDSNNGGFGVLAIDSFNNPLVAYGNSTSVKYASKLGTSWDIETVDVLNNSNIPYQLSLKFDKNDKPYLLYGYSTLAEREAVKLAVRNGSNWNIQPITSLPAIDECGNMVLDSKDNPHFICLQKQRLENNTTVDTLFYVSWTGVLWDTQKVVSDVESQTNGLKNGFSCNGFLGPSICYIFYIGESTYVLRV
jgi:hypothetical protein